MKDVLRSIAAGMTVEDALEDFSELTREDIKACEDYAAENNLER